MKVTVVIPPKVGGEWVVREEKHVSSGQKPIIPRTAPLLCALLERELGDSGKLELSLIEAQRDDLNKDETLEQIKNVSPDIIVTYLSCFHIPWDRAVAELDVPTIGIIVQQNIDQKEAVELYKLSTPFICKSEIEYPVVKAIEEFSDKGTIQNAKGMLLNTPGGLIDSTDAPEADMDTFPIPYHPLFDIEKYIRLREMNPDISFARSFNMNTMKGCIFNCTYCGQANKGSKSCRKQSVECVIRDLTFFYQEFNIRHFAFADNEFAVSMRRAKEICQAIIDTGMKINYVINNRVELFDQELINLLKESGCYNIRLGIETCDPTLQRVINKKIDIPRAKSTIRCLNDAGLQVHLYMTPGIPGETKRCIDMSARFIADVDPHSFSACPLFVMPNSPFYLDLRRKGKLLVKEWSEYRAFRRLCYVNQSYESIGDVLQAQRRLLKKASLYLFWRRFQSGRLDFVWFLRYVRHTAPGRFLAPMVYRILRAYMNYATGGAVGGDRKRSS